MIGRKEAEKRILDKMHDIERIWHEYDPNGDYLHMCISLSEDGNGNDSGNWDTLNFSVNNAYFDRDAATPIDAIGWIDIPGEKYDRCVHEKDDRPGAFWRCGEYRKETENDAETH